MLHSYFALIVCFYHLSWFQSAQEDLQADNLYEKVDHIEEENPEKLALDGQVLNEKLGPLPELVDVTGSYPPKHCIEESREYDNDGFFAHSTKL